MNSFRYYFHCVGIQLKCRMQYPVSFLIQTITQLVMEAGELLAVLLIIRRFGGLKGWSGGDLLLFFGVMSITFYLTEIFCRGITGGIENKIRNGRLDVLLTRPRGILAQLLCEDTDPRRLGCLAIGITAMVLGSKQINLQWTFLKGLALAEAVLCGVLLVLALFLIEAVFCVYSVKSIEVVNALTYGGRSACEYPIDIFPRPLQILFTVFAPFSLTLHVPVSIIVDKNLFGWPTWTAFVCPLAGVAAFLLMRTVFLKSIRHYCSTGN